MQWQAGDSGGGAPALVALGLQARRGMRITSTQADRALGDRAIELEAAVTASVALEIVRGLRPPPLESLVERVRVDRAVRRQENLSIRPGLEL